MKIIYDYQIFEIQKHGGISRYFNELMDYYQDKEDINFNLGIQYSENEYLRSSGLQKIIPPGKANYRYEDFMPNRNFKGKGRLFKFVKKFKVNVDIGTENKFSTLRLLEKQDFDIFHPTYYDPYFLDYLNLKPMVLTIYDMIHELYPETFQLGEKTAFRKSALISRASKIIAISENTKKDIIKFYDINPSKIEVIYLASSLKKSTETRGSFSLPDNYLLYVGSRFSYKNFYFFLRAFKKIVDTNKSIHLVVTGSHNFFSEEVEMIKEFGLNNKVIFKNTNDDGLALLYSKAQAFIYPSYYEGFGIPILEAFSCHCPVICANSSSLPEVGQDGALYFEPKEIDSMVESINKVINDKELKSKMINRGIEINKNFTWEKTAKETLQVYKNLLT